MTGVPAVILAGGQARRMGGGDKCLLDLGGQTLLDQVIARLSPQAGPLAINANGDPQRFARVGLPVLADSFPGFAGPLAGVLAAMEWAAGLDAAQVVTVAGDTPFFPRDLVARLRLAAGDGIALAATDTPGARLRRQPTFGLWPTELRDDLRAALEAGTRKVVAWTDRHNAATARFEAGETDPFFNVNTPEDLALARDLRARMQG